MQLVGVPQHDLGHAGVPSTVPELPSGSAIFTVSLLPNALKWCALLGTCHLPEMVFGGNSLELVHEASGAALHFNALDALHAWRAEGLPPVQVPAAARWLDRSKPSRELIMDYDYTYTTPYHGSEQLLKLAPQGGLPDQASALGPAAPVSSSTTQAAELDKHQSDNAPTPAALWWEETTEQIDYELLQQRDPILFYDEVVLYEDELADNGVALLTVKTRVMPRCWFVLLRYWLRVDGALMRLRDARLFCPFSENPVEVPKVLREWSHREETFESLAKRGLPAMPASYADPTMALDVIKVVASKVETLCIDRSAVGLPSVAGVTNVARTPQA
eukprot:SM000014S00397  [mRNA]  locus=s14:1148346:1151401:+ [translate_table: standard]